MLRLRTAALSFGVGLIIAASAQAQVGAQAQAQQKRQVATAEPMPTTAPAVAAEPAPAPEDPIGVSLQQRLAIPDRTRATEAEGQDRAAVARFYAARTYAPLWVSKAGLSEKGADVIAELGKANDWGLEASEFAIPALVPAAGSAAPAADALAEAELTLSLSVLKYARHARGGRIPDPTGQLSSYLDRKPQLLAPQEVIERIAATDKPAEYLRGLHPKHPQFEKLRQALLKLHNPSGAGETPVTLPPGAQLIPGRSDPQVALLRQRLKVATPASPDGIAGDPNFYDADLKAAVVAFQKERGTLPDGIVGNATRALLNDVEGAPNTARIVANMEQLRWMPDDLGNLYVTINIPEFTLRIVKDGEVIHTERVITGLPDKQTPVFSETIKSIAFQPRWNVPNSIKVNELWPSLARGGTYFRRQGLRLSRNGRDVDPESVDWSSTDIRNYDVYQPPGASNVLGELKFNFPNKHAVYMHDTNARGLFEQPSRTFSHGCVRVRNPRRLAEILMAEDKGWEAGRIADLIANGSPNNEVPVERSIAVHIVYLTAWVDEAGELKTARDVYGHEKRIQQALEGKWSQIAKGPNHLAPVRAPAALASGGGTGFKSLNDLVTSVFGGF